MDDAGPTTPDAGPATPDAGPSTLDAAVAPDAGDAMVEDPDPFELYQRLLDGASESPADLQSEAARLVAAGDWRPIVEFVRDRIATIPSAADGLGSPSTGPDRVLAGRRGTLRAGQGTLRDKAELLFELLGEAGFSPTRRFGNVGNARDYWDAVLTPLSPTFTPSWSDELLASGRRVLGGAGVPALVDPDGTEAHALADALSGALAGQLVLDDVFDLSFSRVPLVEFEADGQTRYGNVFDKTVSAGDSGAMGAPFGGTAPGAFQTAEIALSVTMSGSPDTPIEVVRHSFGTDALVGRQVAVQFVPAVEPETLLDLPLELVREFVPVISLRGHDMSPDEIDASTFSGDIVTLGGDVLSLTSGGELRFRDRVIRQDGTADPSEVQTLELEVSAAGFPNVQLRLAAMDDADGPVAGLPPDAFEVLEDGTPQPFSLLQNNPGPARVLFLLDHSGSMPVAYDVATLATLSRAIAQDIQTAHGTAEFAVKIIGGSTGSSAWTSDLDVLEQAAAVTGGSASNLWRAASESNALAPTVVVCISDGQVMDQNTPAYQANISQLGPVLFVDVVDSQTADVAEVVALTGGDIFAPADASEIGPRASLFIEAALRPSYVLKYAAPDGDDGDRTVTVRMRAAPTVAANGSYRVEGKAATPTILRAEVSITIGDGAVRKTVTRVIAGDAEPPAEVTGAYVDRIRRELLSFNLLGFEVGDPTPHALAKDMFKNKLAARPLVEAVRNDDVEAARAALLEGAKTVPPALLAVLRMPQAAQADAAVFPTGIRAALYRHVSTATGIRRSIDLLPFGPVSARALPPDGSRLGATLAASARAALLEAALFETSTASLLEGATLNVVAPRTALSAIYPALSDAALVARWSRVLEEHRDGYLLVPQSPDTVAFWSVDATTGAVRGILPNGSGGGETFNQEATLVALNMLDFAAGGVGVNWQVSFWISLSKAILKQAIRATKAIASLGVSPPPEGDIMDAVSDVACDMLKDEVFGMLGSPGEHIDFADSTLELGTGDGIPCPF